VPYTGKVVKDAISLAIADLRRRLGHSQQSWAHLLSLSMAAVARWELNQRPERKHLIRLIDLADKNGHRDLAGILQREYRREHGLAEQAWLAADMRPRVLDALLLARSIKIMNAPAQMLRTLEAQKELLEALHQQILEILEEDRIQKEEREKK
jgi:hypothetical protein